ncbi:MULTISPECIES: helix-turn-helix transcriptional regulator [unclassified Crossiella]|uniref:helix-turn-helix domain-containing protein n=1 Tax=unclassified Crossiella TaxID=2620835 RepID=UPI001FFEEE1F|nr:MULTISPECIES: helix-turn-helix transcriptional regulator [unclassified Crossiella]MCK2243482.1 helix-turn-helix transcriptional regulator [Crossiella sp. S99.2]MCK2257340.1 helix-turn-helix transcriptional regulator [Crossiella sp. S99.1]
MPTERRDGRRRHPHPDPRRAAVHGRPSPGTSPPSSPGLPEGQVPMFSPPRLRAYRHRRNLDPPTLALRAHIGLAALRAAEAGTHTPTPAQIARLAAALDCAAPELHTTAADPGDNAQYWAVIAATAPPMTPAEIAGTGAILRRIAQRSRAA